MKETLAREVVANCLGSSDKEQETEKYFSRILGTVYPTVCRTTCMSVSCTILTVY